MGGLNLGGADKNPATTPNEKPEVAKTESEKGAAETSPEVPKTDEEKQDAAESTGADVQKDNVARFSSHPIMRYTVGDFAFENGLLVLKDAEKIAEFRQLLKDLPRSESVRIQELDVKAAEAQVREMLQRTGGATKSTDSSTGERQLNNQIGSGALDANQN